MIRAAVLLTLSVLPALAEDAPKSEAGTAFINRCLADVIDHRVATLKKQVPEYAATLTNKQLFAGASHKAEKVCPCFLHVVGTSDDIPGETPEHRVTYVVDYLDSLDDGSAQSPPMPQVITRLTRLCGQRSSILPPSWIGQ